MAKPEKKRFTFTVEEDLILDSTGDDVVALQTMLATYGYLHGSYSPGTFCPATQRAIRRCQRFYKLKPDGIVGPKTKELLQRPRCGVPDLPASPGGVTPSAPFVLRGCKYPRNELSYAYLNGTPDLARNREQAIVRQAFQTWENVTNLRFVEVGATNNADFRIAWRRGDHGDGSPFDQQGGPQGNILAHAFFPPPCGGPNAGDLHFDEAETWTDDPSDAGILLLQVAIHEIGHLLGLSHSNDEQAIMFALYAPDRVSLGQDDVEGITNLYGEPSDITQIRLAGAVAGGLTRTGDEARYEVTIPGHLSVIVEGPDDADFDLYVRKGEPPTVDKWDFRAFSALANERISIPAEIGATYYVMVRSFDGEGDFTLKVVPGES